MGLRENQSLQKRNFNQKFPLLDSKKVELFLIYMYRVCNKSWKGEKLQSSISLGFTPVFPYFCTKMFLYPIWKMDPKRVSFVQIVKKRNYFQLVLLDNGSKCFKIDQFFPYLINKWFKSILNQFFNQKWGKIVNIR